MSKSRFSLRAIGAGVLAAVVAVLGYLFSGGDGTPAAPAPPRGTPAAPAPTPAKPAPAPAKPAPPRTRPGDPFELATRPSRRGELIVATWNIQNLGKSKSETDIAALADVARHVDLLAVQEVSIGPEGAQAVARLATALGRTGAQWDYAVSPPTQGPGTERYAYLWRTDKAKPHGKPALASGAAAGALDREPFVMAFEAGGKAFRCVNFHAVPSAKNPAAEIAALPGALPARPALPTLVMGDFNLGAPHVAFDGLRKLGLAPVLASTPTSLKRAPEADGGYLHEDYDNILVPTAAVRVIEKGVGDFVPYHTSLEAARRLSDHLPVWAKISLI